LSQARLDAADASPDAADDPEIKYALKRPLIRDEAAGCGAARRLLKISSAWFVSRARNRL
jgi:hypothetical protein